MSFKNISFLELLGPLCSAEQNHYCNIGKGHYEEQFCEIILNLDQWFRRCFKDISYVELWQPFHSVERIHLCNSGRGLHEDQFCKIVLNLDQWLRRRCRLSHFLSI